MSVDIESWVHRAIFNIPQEEQTKELDGEHVVKATHIILDLFRNYNTKATFFTLGIIAEWYPELIEQIRNEGHEIAVHGYTHKLLYDHNKESFDDEIKKSLLVFKRLGIIPRGYRAPCFSSADFLTEVLCQNEIVYDSSIFPIRTPLYDGTAYDGRPFISEEGITRIPCSVLKISKIRLPAGGFYLRLFGARWNYYMLREIEKRNGIAVVYFHPWELLDVQSVMERSGKISMKELPFLKKKYAHYKIPMVDKLEYLMKKMQFTNFESSLGSIQKDISQ